MIKKLKNWINNLSFWDCLFILLFLVNIIVRLHNLDYPLGLGGGESSRDYLIAHNMVKYHEFVLTGPWSSIYGDVKNSPLYYYLLSFILLIHDDFVFLLAINILMQVATNALIYLIGKRVFNSKTGFVAALLFSFSMQTLYRSQYLFQPFFIEPFVNLSFFLLFIAFVTRQFKPLVFAVSLATFSAVIHNSGYSVLPFFFLIAFLILRQEKKSFKKYVSLFLVPLLVLLVSYLPVLFYFQMYHVSFYSRVILGKSVWGGSTYISSLGQFKENFIMNLRFIFDNFSLPFNILYYIPVGFLIIAFKRNRSLKFILVIAIFIIQTVFFCSFLTSGNTFLYLTPILGLFSLLLSALVIDIFSGNIAYDMVAFVIVLYLLTTISGGFNTLQKKNGETNFQRLDTITNLIIQNVKQIQSEKNYSELTFFQVTSYRTGNYSASDAVILVPLENKLDMRFVKNNEGGDGYTQMNTNDYVFLACYDLWGAYDRTQCISTFNTNKSYEMLKTVYDSEPVSVFLLRKRV